MGKDHTIRTIPNDADSYFIQTAPVTPEKQLGLTTCTRKRIYKRIYIDILSYEIKFSQQLYTVTIICEI